MAKKLISFLGTNAYLHTIYTIDNFKSEPVRYIQEALAQYLCKDWGESDKIAIFATMGENGSIEKNWKSGQISKFDRYGQEFEKEPKGLNERLKNLNLKCNIEMVEIPDGILENEIWKIIEAIDNQVEQDDKLYIDITHSFRYIPMIIPAMITFLKTTKNIELKAIYYGAFEVLGSPHDITSIPLQKRVAPIRELIEIYKMIEWSEATNAFLKYGSGQRLIEQIDSIDKSKMDKKTKGIFNPLKNNIAKIDEALKFNNVFELKKLDNPKKIKQINLDKNPNLFALKKLLPQIERFTSQWEEDEVKNGLLAAEWSLENDRIAQSLTYTQESLITYFCNLFNWNAEDKEKYKEQREAVNFLIKIVLGKNSIEEHSKKDKEWFKNSINEILEKLSSIDKKILEDFLKISDWRNIINHAKKGDRKVIQKEFPSILKNYLKKSL